MGSIEEKVVIVIGDRPDITCRLCNVAGHFSKDCPGAGEKGNGSYGEAGGNFESGTGCFNCGQEGHSKADCTEPRVDTRACKHCGEVGHLVKECPTRPPQTCKNCGEEGHVRAECKNNRKIDWGDVPTETPERGWELLEKASADYDVDDFKLAFKIYVKALPDITYKELEEAFRNAGFNYYLIAQTKDDLMPNYTIMNLQGKIGCKYQVTFQSGPKPRRANEKAVWPESVKENLTRLEDAGVVVGSHVAICGNCKETGHISKNCPLEKVVHDRPEIKCVNCDELGHRARDCTQKRKAERDNNCRNCGQPGHRSNECTEPRNMDGVECKRCKEMGHFGKDCPNAPSGSFGCRNCGQEGHKAADCTEEKNMDLVTCRNCDQTGHFSKDCPLPKDWSKVICNNCGQSGHTIKRCKEPVKDEGGEFTVDTYGTSSANNGSTDAYEYTDHGAVAAAPTTTVTNNAHSNW